MDCDQLNYDEILARIQANSSKTAEVIEQGMDFKKHVETSHKVIYGVGVSWATIKGKFVELRSKKLHDKARDQFYKRNSVIYLCGSANEYVDFCNRLGLIDDETVINMSQTLEKMQNAFGNFLADNRVNDEDIYAFDSSTRYRTLMGLFDQYLGSCILYKTECDEASIVLQKMLGRVPSGSGKEQ